MCWTYLVSLYNRKWVQIGVTPTNGSIDGHTPSNSSTNEHSTQTSNTDEHTSSNNIGEQTPPNNNTNEHTTPSSNIDDHIISNNIMDEEIPTTSSMDEHNVSQNSSITTVLPLLFLKVLITDAMASIHPLKKSSKVRTLQDLQGMFIKNMEKSLHGYDEARIVFDRYLDVSLKDKTRMNRSSTSAEIEYKLHPDMRLTMSIRDLLSSSKTKRNLTIMFAKALLEHFRSKAIRLYVIYDNKIVGSEEHNHEEADTLRAFP